MNLEAEVKKEPISIFLSEEMRREIERELGMTEEEIWKADYPNRPVSSEFLPLGYGGRLMSVNTCGFPYLESSKYWPLNWIQIIVDEVRNKIEEQQFALWLKDNPEHRGRNDPELSRVYELFARAYQKVKRIYH